MTEMNDIMIWRESALTPNIPMLQHDRVEFIIEDHDTRITISNIGTYRGDFGSDQIYISIRAPSFREILRINLSEDNAKKLMSNISNTLSGSNVVFKP